MCLLVGRGGALRPLSVDRRCSLLRLLVISRGGARGPLCVDRGSLFLRLLPRQSWWRSSLSALRRPPVLALAPSRRPTLAVGLPAFASSEADARSCAAASSSALAIGKPVSTSMIGARSCATSSSTLAVGLPVSASLSLHQRLILVRQYRQKSKPPRCTVA